MATRPITCAAGNQDGFIFFRDKFILEEDNSKVTFFDFKDMLDEVVAYSRLKVTLKAGRNIKISQTDVGDENGYVKWIAVKVKYPEPVNSLIYGSQVPIITGTPTPSNGIAQTNKYINWTYQGTTYNIGDLMVLSGSKVGSSDSELTGWNLSEDTLPYTDGGIIFTNPHSDIDVKLEILVAR